MRVFIWSDLLAGLLQAVGLGLTFSRAKQAGPWGVLLPKQAGPGQDVMYAGLLLQTLSLAAALSLLAVAYVKAGKADRKYGYTTFHRDGPGYVPLTPRFKTFLVVLPLAGVCVLVRCAYRSAAAWGGIGSPIARDQMLWLVAEGVMLTEAIVTLAAFHPAIWLDDGISGRTYADDTEQDGARASKLGKRLTVGTFATGMTDLEHGNARDSRQDLGDISQVIFSSALIAPSDVSSEGSPSRRGSAGEQVVRDAARTSSPAPYDPHLPARRYSEDITAESRALSPLEAEEEADRVSIIPEPPRKSSKRISRALEMARLQQQQRDEEDDDDRLEVASVVLPPRKPSKRETNHGDREDDLEDVALTSTYSQSLYSQ
ncbi:putative parasitic phase-specific protein psp-1 [Diaporthe ampelina]|uniref:Putative parasitic phase-specific protein psp-1 n=1 Tax=Diaporthe ampelina TaxID=1214573 RepID=A0A0G2HAS1_9PEZI|nr:putative parasitic phase-specific protein psp-1 [Diaporthe ampelina]